MNWLNTPLILDISVVVIIGIFVFLGYKRGFFRTIIYTVGNVAAFILSFVLSKYIAVMIYDNFIADSIIKATAKFINNAGQNVKIDAVIQSTLSKLPEICRDFIFSGGNQDKIIKEIALKSDNTIDNVAKVITQEYAAPVLHMILQAVVCFVLLILCLFVVRIIAKIISFGVRRSIFGPLDGLCGALLGILQGIIIVFVLVLALKTTIFLTSDNFEYINTKQIEETSICKLFYNFEIKMVNDWI